MFDYTKEPYVSCAVDDVIWEGLIRWARDGTPVGDFLTAVIKNDLKEAVGRADDVNVRCLFEIVMFVYNELPGPCWGSDAKVKAWYKKRKEDGPLKPM